jgi:adenylate cyclase
MTATVGKIIVVDDDLTNRVLLANILGDQGFEVDVAENGMQGLELLKAGSYDVVLLDLLMPKMNGYQVLEAMKKDSSLESIPVIVISTDDDIDSIIRCIELGATDHLPKPFDPVMLHARVKASLATKRLYDQLTLTNLDLQQEISVRKETEEKLRVAEKSATELSEFLKQMFGRYISTEVMTSLMEDPSATELGGENRQVAIMITDLRGFTSISERLRPEQVVRLLNIYFETMVEIVFKYNGTINEISGDSLVVIFGAPKAMPDRTQRTVACAIEMQNAMVEVNQQNRSQDLPEIEMGIGLNEAEVIVGNIGSIRRTKYGAIGSGMNQASRIESYTVGGQIFVSESIVEQIGEFLRIDNQLEVFPKGAGESFNIYDIGGIAGNY